MTTERLEYLRTQIQAECISYGEIAELQDLAGYIDPGDVELLEWAGVPEGLTFPTALEFISTIANMTKDGEDDFVMENDDAFDTLHRLISDARELFRMDVDQ